MVLDNVNKTIIRMKLHHPLKTVVVAEDLPTATCIVTCEDVVLVGSEKGIL